MKKGLCSNIVLITEKDKDKQWGRVNYKNNLIIDYAVYELA
jgi:hypothetical protein